MSTDNHERGAPTTLLGQLQRGSGQGYLRALEADRSEVHAFLTECVIRDPRWDSQLELRANYYAELMICTGMDEFTPIAAYLERVDEHGANTGQGWLAIDTLGELARRRHHGAISILRRVVDLGVLWEEALGALAMDKSTEAITGLDEVIVNRFPGKTLLELPSPPNFRSPPWTWWKRTNSHIAQLCNEAEQREPPRTRLPRVDERMATSKLLSRAEPRNHRKIGEILSRRLDPEDVTALVKATLLREEWSARAALWALALQGNPAALSVALDIVWARRKTRRFPLRHAAYRYIEALPPEHTLSQARQWFLSRSWRMRVAGEGVLKRHAQLADVPMLRKGLGIAREKDDIYRECSIIDALARLPETGPYPEIIISFQCIPYSWGRRRAAAAMAATDLSFPKTWAVECLWDCEYETKIIGCNHADASQPGVLERLRELANDRYEEPEVRRAAAARVQRRGRG